MQESKVADNQQATIVSEIEKAWLAGIIDGEGSIRIDFPNGSKNSPQPRIAITNTDPAIIEKAANICSRLGANAFISTRNKMPKHKLTKDVLVFRISKIQIILRAVLPYLTGKKSEQALLMYRFCELRGAKDVNHLPNSQRMYTKEEIDLIWSIKQTRY